MKKKFNSPEVKLVKMQASAILEASDNVGGKTDQGGDAARVNTNRTNTLNVDEDLL